MPPTAAEPGSGGRLRLRLELAYDGTDFSGWATQPERRTVQGVVAAALGTVLRIPQPALTVAGRTDAGVHARGQVCHVDVPIDAWQNVPGRSDRTPAAALVQRLAGVLPSDVRVRSTDVAPEGFDARFSAIWRRYVYRVADTAAGPDPLRRASVLWHKPRTKRSAAAGPGMDDAFPWPAGTCSKPDAAHRRPGEGSPGLDLAAMNAAAAGLLGEHDFAAFCRARDGATTIRTLRSFSWARAEGGLALATIEADAFCHNQVRAMVGALLAVGDGRRPIDWPATVLAAGVRDPGVTVVAAHGLTLEEVGYPPDDQLAARAALARRRRTLS